MSSFICYCYWVQFNANFNSSPLPFPCLSLSVSLFPFNWMWANPYQNRMVLACKSRLALTSCLLSLWCCCGWVFKPKGKSGAVSFLLFSFRSLHLFYSPYLLFPPSLFVSSSSSSLVKQPTNINKQSGQQRQLQPHPSPTLHSHLSTFSVALEIIIRFDQEESTDHRTRPGSHFFFPFPSLPLNPTSPASNSTNNRQPWHLRFKVRCFRS